MNLDNIYSMYVNSQYLDTESGVTAKTDIPHPAKCERDTSLHPQPTQQHHTSTMTIVIVSII